MRRPFARRVTVVLAALAWSVVAADEPKPRNLLPNGGFEKVVNGAPTGWLMASSAGPFTQYRISRDKPREGKNCLRINHNAEWSAAISDQFPIDRAKSYTLTGWTRVRKGTSLIKFDYFRDAEHQGQTLTETFDASSPQWRGAKVKAELDQFPAATHIVVTVGIIGESDADFDDLALTAQ